MLKILRSFLRYVIRIIIRGLYRVEVKGTMRFTPGEPCIIIANHVSYLDGVLLGLFLPVEPFFLLNKGVLSNFLVRLLVSVIDYYSIDPLNPLNIRYVVKRLECNPQTPIMLFPEGRISLTGALMKIYDGAGFAAAKTSAKVIPIYIDGAVWTKFARTSGDFPKLFFHKITLNIMPSFTLAIPETGSVKTKRLVLTRQIRQKMIEARFASSAKDSLMDTFLITAKRLGWGRKFMEDNKFQPLSYRSLLKMILMLGRLIARNTHDGEVLALFLPNTAVTGALVLGLPSFNRIPAMLNFSTGSESLSAACQAANIQTVLTSRAFIEAGHFAEKIAQLPVKQVIYLEDLRLQLTWVDKLWLLGFALWFPRKALPKQTQDQAPSLILFTSGSEGKPKGVVHTQLSLSSNIEQILSVIDVGANDKFFTALPMFHAFGLTAGYLLPLLSGAKIFLYPTPLHYRIIPELIYDRRCTVIFSTSTFLRHYAKFACGQDFESLRYIVAGAEKLPTSLQNLYVEKFSRRIYEGYGATELAPVVSSNLPMMNKSNSVGVLLPGMEAKLVPVPGIDEGGELHLRGPNLMLGYLRADNPGVIEAPESSLGKDWYATGDIVTIDKEGFITIVDRLKRFAKIAGEMVSLEAVENIAAFASAEGQHAAISDHIEGRGERIVLFTNDDTLTRERLSQAQRQLGVASIAVPHRIEVITSIPVLGSGKTDYQALKNLLRDESSLSH